jgi:hypothetical protein
MTTTAFIGMSVILPHRVAQIERAWIGGAADNRTAHRTCSRTQGGSAYRRADGGAASSTQQTARYRPISGVGAAPGDNKYERKGRTWYNLVQEHVCSPSYLRWIGNDHGNPFVPSPKGREKPWRNKGDQKARQRQINFARA